MNQAPVAIATVLVMVMNADDHAALSHHNAQSFDVTKQIAQSLLRDINHGKRYGAPFANRYYVVTGITNGQDQRFILIHHAIAQSRHKTLAQDFGSFKPDARAAAMGLKLGIDERWHGKN